MQSDQDNNWRITQEVLNCAVSDLQIINSYAVELVQISLDEVLGRDFSR